MVYTGAEYSSQALFEELKKQVKQENIHSYDEYAELVDNLIEEKKSYGFLSDEEDLVGLKQSLQLRWNEIEESLSVL